MRSIPSGTPAHLSHWLHRAAALCITLALAACGGGGESPLAANPSAPKQAEASSVAVPDVVVTGITKLSESRVSRTVYEYVFQVAFKNNGTDAKSGVAATLTGVGPGTTIVDGTVTVGNLAAGATVMPSDTITLRQDRTLPFNVGVLVWAISADISAPPPPPSTVAGLDADSDGVRDDVQAFISSTYGPEPSVASALVQFAKGLQQSALSDTPAAIEGANIRRMNASMCLVDRVGATRARDVMARVRSVQLNTVERIRAEYAFRKALGGTVRTWNPPATNGSCES